MTIRERVREWIGTDGLQTHVNAMQSDMTNLCLLEAIELKQAERHAEILEAIKSSQPVHVSFTPDQRIPLYTDYESSQVSALNDFKEKK